MLILQFAGDTLGTARRLEVVRAGETPDVTETWHVELEVEAATPAALETIVAALHDAEGTTGELKLQADGSDVRTLAAADCRLGPTLAKITEQDRAPGEAHNRRRISLEFQATLQDAASAVQSHRYVVRIVAEAGRPERIVTGGQAVLRKGEVPADDEALVLPVLAGGFRRVRQVVTRDVRIPSIEYEVADEQVFRALPGGVDDGHYVISESLSRDGRPVRTISGFFTGVSARPRALELRADDDHLVNARIDENPFTRRVDFEFVELLDGTEAIASTETLTFTTTRRVVDHPLLDDALPAYRQQIGAPQTEVVQEGSAVGSGRHPSPPAPRFAADLLERRVQYSLPHPGLPADQRWVTTWRYVSRGRAVIRVGV